MKSESPETSLNDTEHGKRVLPHKKKRRSTRLWILLGLAIIPVFYLHITALPAADDFYYAIFWRNGPAEFWRLTLDHYNTFNGRVLVHALAQTVLYFPPIVFAVINTALLIGIGSLGGLLQGTERSGHSLHWSVFFFLTQLLLLPTSILTEGLLWRSASYNYMLPVFLMLLALHLLNRFFADGHKSPYFLFAFFIIQLAAGATTEQCGFMTAAVTGFYGLCRAVYNRKDWWKLFPAPLLNLAGYCTIFLSPATQKRAASGVHFDLENLSARLLQLEKAYFSRSGVLFPLVFAAILLVACLLLPGAKKQLNLTVPTLLFGAFSSILIMLPAGEFSPRTMLPAALILLLVSARCLVIVLKLYREGSRFSLAVGVFMLALSCVVCTPMLIGVTQNYALELRNRAAIRAAQQSGTLYYCIDYDKRWCYPSLMYYDAFTYNAFWEANRLTDCSIYLESNQMKKVYLNGKRLSSPAYVKDGNVYFSLRDVIEGLGGTVDFADGIITLRLDGEEFIVSSEQIIHRRADGGFAEYTLQDRRLKGYYKACYIAEVYQDVFGIDVRLDKDCYVVEKALQA